MTQALLLFAVALAMLWSYRRWWLAVRWLLVLIVVEGAIRKWVLPEQQQLVYLVKDFLVVAIFAGFLVSGKRIRRVRPPAAVVVPLMACALWGGFEIFNPRLPSLLVGIFGWKSYFWYAPLLWVVPAAFRDLPDFERFVRRYALLVLPVVALGLLQFRAPTTSVLNRYAWGELADTVGRVATFGQLGAARVTSTFSYITGYSTFLVAVGILLMVALALRGFRVSGNGLLWAALLAVPIGVLVSGSRGPLILLAGIFPMLFLFARRGMAEKSRALLRLVSTVAVGAVLISFVAMPALEAFTYRVRSTEEDVVERALQPLFEPFEVMDLVGPFAYGIGATHQAASALVPDLRPGSWLDGIEAENESTRVMIELGPLGFLAHFGYRIALVVMAFGIARRARLSASRIVAFGAAFFLLAQLPGAVVFNVYGGIYFWFLAGAALLAQATEREQIQAASPSGPRRTVLRESGPRPVAEARR
ncbi:MAG: hypothetical protein F9K16_05885 [Thermoanaerobaculia bacterium]|nr:MAG: hypothetical protein F9K16_05885 [Thermoanaerobaculia bacterium]MBZ0100789.1 hypothetical protein [Thermoanaerobaculia bacterium]